MTKSTKTLRLNFKNENGKKTALTITNALPDLKEEQVRQAMATICSGGVFEKEGVKTYSTIQSAAYIERNVNTIFDDRDDDKSKQA